MITEEELNYIDNVLMQHTIILATTGKGKSFLSDAIQGNDFSSAADQKITKELEIEEEKRNNRMKERDMAMKKAYLENTDKDDLDMDLDCISMSISELHGEDYNNEDSKIAVFMMLPSTIFGNGVRWGFDDTEVRNEIWEYVESISTLDLVATSK